MGDVLFENEGWNVSQVELLARAVLDGSARPGDEKRLAQLVVSMARVGKARAAAAAVAEYEAAPVLTETPRPQQTERCEVCDWPLVKSSAEGCVPGNCSYRPREGSDEHKRVKERRAALAKQQTEAPRLEWSPGFPPPGDYRGTAYHNYARYALDLRRNIEAIDARLRKLEGSR